MPDSNITILGLATEPGFSQIELTYDVNDPHAAGLPSLSLDVVEVWAATANDRAHASFAKVAEGDKVSAVHSGLARGAAHYYWVRAKNRSGLFGDFHPSGATSGVAATEAVGGLTVPAVASLSVFGVGGLASLQWTVTDPNANDLGSLALDAVEVHAAPSNNRSLATWVAEGQTFALYAGYSNLLYHWVRPRHINGTYGNWYPSSSTGGSTISQTGSARFLSNGGGSGIPALRLDYTGPDSGGGPALYIQSSRQGAYIGNTGGGVALSIDQSAAAGYGIFVSKTTTGYAYYANVSAGAGGYGPFTGSHDALIEKDAEIEPGDIVCDVAVMARRGVSDTLTIVRRSTSENQRGSVGVFASRSPLKVDGRMAAMPTVPRKLMAQYDRAIFNGLGEGQINVCDANGPIEAGDLIVSSSVAGKGMRQADDIVRSCTVAKAREAAVFVDGRAQVACIYLCG